MHTIDAKPLIFWRYLILISFILLIIGIHQLTFAERNYRQDEINTIHASKTMTPSEITAWMATNIHPPAWRLLANSWIDAFGDGEVIVRWLSVLANVVTFALIFRLGNDLMDWRFGLLSVILLGLYSVPASYMNELRPYPYLIMLTAGLHLFFLRWIRTFAFRYMLGYVIFGILGLYTHYYTIYIFPAHVLFFLITVRWQPRLYFHTFNMWFLIGLSFLGWVLPFIHSFTVQYSGGIYYALPNETIGIQLLLERLAFTPQAIGQFLLLMGLVTPLFFSYASRQNKSRRWSQYDAWLLSIVIGDYYSIISMDS